MEEGKGMWQPVCLLKVHGFYSVDAAIAPLTRTFSFISFVRAACCYTWAVLYLYRHDARALLCCAAALRLLQHTVLQGSPFVLVLCETCTAPPAVPDLNAAAS